MDEDFDMDDQQRRQRRQDTSRKTAAVTCGQADTRQQGQLDSPSATMTSVGPQSATSNTRPSDVFIPQAHSGQPSSLTTTTNQSMTRPLARTRTLGQMGRTESFTDVLSTPVYESGSGEPMSLLQHRESLAALNNDDDDEEQEEQEQEKLPGIRINIDTDDDIENETQRTESQDVPMSEPPVLQSSQRQSANPTSSFKAPGKHLAVNTTKPTDSRRFPSPAPTEPEDPYPEVISKQLAKQKIKVRDFAMCPPYTSGARTPSTPTFSPCATATPTSPASWNADQNAYSAYSGQILDVPLTPETFNPREALGEFEFRLRQTPRTLPIPGKTLRRLIEVGFVTENEVESRCSAEDLKSLDDFDARNRARLLRLTALREQRAKDLGVSLEMASGPEDQWGFTPTGAYPYLTFKFDAVPTVSERDELVKSVRQMFVHNDRFIRMAMATERARERDRLEAEEVLKKRRREDAEKERLERERVEREMLQIDRDEVMREASNGNIKAGLMRTVPELQPPAEIAAAPINSRKRSPHQAWADDEDSTADNDIEDLDAKRLRLARSQSETWYEQERRLQQEAQSQTPASHTASPQPVSQSQQHYLSPARISSRPHSRPHSQSPRKPANVSHSQSNPQSQHTHSRSQSQPTNFIPPEIQYPAPLSTYDPELYPDAASVIESQSQSQGRPSYREPTPPASPTTDDDERGGTGAGRSSTVGRGIGVGEDGEEDTRPNALKRSPKKGLKRSLTRGRTLVEIC